MPDTAAMSQIQVEPRIPTGHFGLTHRYIYIFLRGEGGIFQSPMQSSVSQPEKGQGVGFQVDTLSAERVFFMDIYTYQSFHGSLTCCVPTGVFLLSTTRRMRSKSRRRTAKAQAAYAGGILPISVGMIYFISLDCTKFLSCTILQDYVRIWLILFFYVLGAQATFDAEFARAPRGSRTNCNQQTRVFTAHY